MSDQSAQSLALALGVSALVTVGCRRLKIPALLPMLGVGIGLGTSGLGIVDGASLGSALTGFITVAIGLLIFEGALHLNKEELRRAPRAVWGLLTVGALITWVASAAIAHYFLGMTVPVSILLGATVIVTGPTVVQPILKLIHLPPRLHTTLAAEAVLIDPIGVVATVTTLEVLRLYLISGAQISLAREGLWIFAKPLLGGTGVGVFMGMLGYWLLNAVGRATKPDTQVLNLIAIGVCMTCVGLGESIAPEGGLAAVTICGVIMARATVLGATELRAFKELLAVMLVGTLFVLLASRFDVARLSGMTWREGAFVLALLFVVRPLSVAVSTWRSSLDVRERLFAATFAPRGIVALSVAAVASSELGRLLVGSETGPLSRRDTALLVDAQRLDTIMFVVIAGSVLLASTFSPLWAWILRVRAGEGNTVLLIGANALSVHLATVLGSMGITVRILDNNAARVAGAVAAGTKAAQGDATDQRWMDDVGSPPDTGWVVAWTGNHDVDQLAARWAEDRLGKGHTAIWSSRKARGVLEAADIGSGEPVTEAIGLVEDGRLAITSSPDHRKLRRVFGWVENQKFRLNVPAS